MTNSAPTVLFLSHGGGPLPLLGDPGHIEMVAKLQEIASSIPRPSAILVISAHWEAVKPTLTASAQPPLIYDYYGFPDESYEIQYPCPGEPALAAQVQQVLLAHNMPVELDSKRGYDHGVFVPLKIMYPQADIPCVQLSLLKSLDPAEHIRLGQTLTGIDYGNLLIVGSGFSFHNLRAFFARPSDEIQNMNAAFEQWLIETCTSIAISENERGQRLIQWEQAPHARFCHPREEHLLPLHVCYGVTQRACRNYYTITIMNKQSSLYLW